jgi:hypothetical protein
MHAVATSTNPIIAVKARVIAFSLMKLRCSFSVDHVESVEQPSTSPPLWGCSGPNYIPSGNMTNSYR